MKNLRRAYPEKKIRYFHCGEYGSKLKRPHYHALLYGIDFSDKVCYDSVKTSCSLQKLWPHGFVSVGDITPESTAYVARYCLKKVNGDSADEHYVDRDTGVLRQPEYTTMSRRPGIGADWIKKHLGETYRDDTIVSRGYPSQPPRYYDKQLVKLKGEETLKKIKIARAVKALNYSDDTTPERLKIREIVKSSSIKTNLQRSYEND